MTDCLIVWLFDYLIVWLFDCLIVWSSDRLIVWLFDYLIYESGQVSCAMLEWCDCQKKCLVITPISRFSRNKTWKKSKWCESWPKTLKLTPFYPFFITSILIFTPTLPYPSIICVSNWNNSCQIHKTAGFLSEKRVKQSHLCMNPEKSVLYTQFI